MKATNDRAMLVAVGVLSIVGLLMLALVAWSVTSTSTAASNAEAAAASAAGQRSGTWAGIVSMVVGLFGGAK